MSANPDEIRGQIEQTRHALSNDVNSLTDAVSPRAIASRQAGRARSAVASAKDRVMGAADSATSSTRDSAHSVTSTISDAPAAVRSNTAGNPLAAGLIAFGVGWLAGSLLPSTAKEQNAASAAKDAIMPEVTGIVKDTANELNQPMHDAATAVKESATDAASNVKDEAKDAAGSATQQS